MTDLHNLLTRNDTKEEKMERFWICWVEYTDGGQHYKHYSLEAVEKEAERLARLPHVEGRAVYLFECIGKCQVKQTPIEWEVPYG